ncbi:MAG: hypothetical protein KC656_05595 [Myxococcales bacterium]|nr:hypothetical protein [Myxococcales bacterium]
MRDALAPAAATGVVMLGLIGLCSGYPCVSTGLRYGLWLEKCPATDLRASADLQASGMVRGDWGLAHLSIQAHWMTAQGPGGYETSAPISHTHVDIGLIDPDGNPVPGVELRDPAWSGDRLSVGVKLPKTPDGLYKLRATVEPGFETVVVDAELPLFTPALVHVVGDRPLYKPGQEVLLRAAVLARTDAAPIAARPGTWRIRDPEGTEMLQEATKTDAWGVASTTFPLAVDAEEGTWTATFDTGNDSRTVSFDVRPFKLPRFTVELEPEKSWYGANDTVRLEGRARYTSGAPVGSAEVEIRLAATEGRWPLPLAWEEPRTTRTDAQGRFRLDLGGGPADLMETSKIAVTASVVDDAGERRGGGATLKLSEDDLLVQTVTEFGGGLVADFNNRAYLRVMTPDGRALPNTDITVRNAYQPDEPEMKARTDEDGVASIQLDPGEPVTLVTEPPPLRPRPFSPAAPRFQRANAHPGGRGLTLDERRAMDRLHPGISACGVNTVGDQTVQIGVQVASSGAVTGVLANEGRLASCVASVMRGARMPVGEPRTYDLAWVVPDSLVPSLDMDWAGVRGLESAAKTALEEAALDARTCFTRGVGVEGAPVAHVHWRHEADTTSLVTTVAMAPSGTGLTAPVLACVQRALGGARLARPASSAGMGEATFTLVVPQPPGSVRQVAQTDTGFQLQVVAHDSTAAIGRTRVTFPVGWLPALRMRATPSLAHPGDTLAIELLRGPDFRGDLPDELVLREGSREIAKAKVDKKARRAELPIPADVDGFLHIEALGARTVVFVQPDDALSVELATDATSYAPGDTAKLTVTTRAGEKGVEASVTLAGVDKALGELAPLTSPDDWGDVMVRATGADAFGAFGPRALQLGQVRGQNAAMAAVLLVSDLPMDPAGDQAVYGSGAVVPPVEEALITGFYRGLERLVVKVRAWEKESPPETQMDPPTMARLWREMLKEAQAAGEPVVDGYGRPLALAILPDDLLAQTDPRQVVADSTRLPEDVIGWTGWVRENP